MLGRRYAAVFLVASCINSRKSDKLLFHRFLIDQELKRRWTFKIWRDIRPYISQNNIFDNPLANVSIQQLPS